MVQVLPYVPTFGEKLIPTLAQAGNLAAQGIQKRHAMTALQKMLNPQLAMGNGSGEMSPMQNMQNAAVQSQIDPSKIMQIYDLAEQAVGPQAAQQLSQAYLTSQKSAEKEQSDIRKEQRQQQIKEKQETKDKVEHQANIQKTFNVASSLLAKNTPGVGISPGAVTGLSRKAVEGRNTFNTLKGKFESILLPMVNKGTLAKERFNFILSQIPDASDSQRAIAGKLRGLAETLSEDGFPIDTKVLDSIPWASEDLKNLGKEENDFQKVEAGTKLTEDLALDLLKKAGNDKEKARSLARELGYEF